MAILHILIITSQFQASLCPTFVMVIPSTASTYYWPSQVQRSTLIRVSINRIWTGGIQSSSLLRKSVWIVIPWVPECKLIQQITLHAHFYNKLNSHSDNLDYLACRKSPGHYWSIGPLQRSAKTREAMCHTAASQSHYSNPTLVPYFVIEC